MYIRFSQKRRTDLKAEPALLVRRRAKAEFVVIEQLARGA